MTVKEVQQEIQEGIPSVLPDARDYDRTVSHAPKRKDVLNQKEKRLAVENALRYFKPEFHEVLAPEFYAELKHFGRIYMYRFRPRYEMYARPIDQYPARCQKAAAIMLMIQNNLDPAVAQHPHELITYGGNGAVFQNWAQYLLTMQYLANMDENQTLHMYSGHPMGLFPSSHDAPRVVVTNGMMIPNYSSQDDWEKYSALGVTQYGQMTAGSYMYIGPQGIVHGTTITILNAGRRNNADGDLKGKLFVSSGLGGMSGAQPKAGNIAGCVSVIAEVNESAIRKRHAQGWVDEVISDQSALLARITRAKESGETVSIAFHGNIVDLWELLDANDVFVDLGSDQTSLHNPWAGGYYPAGLSFQESNDLMSTEPAKFKDAVQRSLIRQAEAIHRHAAKGTYFFDYGNAFLLEASRAGAPVMSADGQSFRYPSYVEDIMGPLCFDFGFGPFRWVCTTGKDEDLRITDDIAARILEELFSDAPAEIRRQLEDNISWIRKAQANKLVVGSKARILYADAIGRIKIARAFNEAIRNGEIGPVVLGRDHHDVSGTDSPYRETANIYDGSRYTADMAIHNVIGDSFRGATWVSIHNGGGVGWGEVINGGFGLLLDGSAQTDVALQRMLYFDVNNGIARRAWARNPNALWAIKNELKHNPLLNITVPNLVDSNIIEQLDR